jgi:hypothetical protein
MRIDRVRQSNFPIHHMSVNARGVLRECRIARFSKSNFAASGQARRLDELRLKDPQFGSILINVA